MNPTPLDSFLQRPEVPRVLQGLRARGLSIPDLPEDLQRDWSLPFMRWLVEETTSGLTAQLNEEDPPGIIVSTHRDIVCDPALYNLARVRAGRPTTHIVLGTNLAGRPWVKDLMSLNKALFIDRSLRGRSALKQQMELSQSIRAVVEDGGHVWIAQAPGRTKNGCDQTHPGLLRMLALAFGGEDIGVRALDGLLRGLAVRYDRNPCDHRIVVERMLGSKPEGEDELCMVLGLEGWKGRVQIGEAPVLHLDETSAEWDWSRLAAHLDRDIQALPIHGEWAEADSADDGSFLRHLEGLVLEVQKAIPGAAREAITSMAIEVYREVPGPVEA